MSNQKFIRRAFLAAALTMSGAHTTTASGFQQGSYQPGQRGQQIPQGDSKVTQELNRMFQENGQQMPSMNAKELPNANVPTQGQIRPIQSSKQLPMKTGSLNFPQSTQTGSSGKQSVLGRFFGKLRGDKGDNNPDYRPPVPPVTPGSPVRSVQVPNGTVSPIPPRSGATVRAANAQAPASPATNAAGPRFEYTQPGSAPGFMSTAGGAKVLRQQPPATPSSGAEFDDDSAGEKVRTRQNEGTTTSDVAADNAAADEFEALFGDSVESLEETELMDLDSLIEIPAAAAQPVTLVEENTTPPSPGTSEATDFESAQASEESPFTGVQLDSNDAQSFDIKGGTDEADVGSFGDPAAPMDDFDFNLPAINSQDVDLPPVDDEATGKDPDLIETQAVEPVQPTEGATQEKPTTSTNTAAEAEFQPNANDSEEMGADVPKAMISAETARRQMAEQERRQLQQRQIQSRVGLTGFKGFCPVALRESRELIDSNDRFTSTFGLQMYRFSSAESKAAFDIDPPRYAPAAGGSDVVVLVNSGEEQAGQLDYALWYRDRLYLFRSRETMTLFSKDPQRFASQY